MSKKKYLAFDTETGGLNPKEHSLLQAAFVITDENLNILDTLNFKLKNQTTNATFKITPGALACNNINLIEHNKEAITYDEATILLFKFLEKHKETKFTALGHNITFDLDFIYEYLLPKEEFSKFIDYHLADTSVVGNFLKAKNKGPTGRKFSLKNWAEFYKIPIEETELHNAMEDVLLTIKVYKAMLEAQ